MADHNAKLVWRDGMTFDLVSDGKTHLPLVLASGHNDPAEGEQGLSPMGLVVAGLAGCTAMDVISILKKKRQDVTSLEIVVEGDQQDQHPRIYKNIQIVYRVGGNVDEKAVTRAIELSIERYCPVNGMLKEIAEIDYRYEIVD